MQRYLIITLLGLILIGILGCSGTSAADKMIVKYDVELSMVRKASDINQRYQAPVADTMDMVRYAYEDDLFRSIWSVNEAGWNLSLYNKSEKPLLIDWDEVSYMDVDNMGHWVLVWHQTQRIGQSSNPKRDSQTRQYYRNSVFGRPCISIQHWHFGQASTLVDRFYRSQTL